MPGAPSLAAERHAVRVHVLGSGSGYPTAQRDTASLLVGLPGDWTLVDCPGAIVHKLARIGVAVGELRRIILTHNHVDHIYGLPHLIHAMAIDGGVDAVELRAPRETLATIEQMVATHQLTGNRYPRLLSSEVALRAGEEVGGADGRVITSAPAAHGRDTIALRFSTPGGAICYSSDTRPSAEVEELARGARILFHDCAGPHRRRDEFLQSHSSAREAARVASRAQVGELVLMHLVPRDDETLRECLAEARGFFDGIVQLAKDGDCRTLEC